MVHGVLSMVWRMAHWAWLVIVGIFWHQIPAGQSVKSTCQKDKVILNGAAAFVNSQSNYPLKCHAHCAARVAIVYSYNGRCG
uniref:LCCL domain-containing protein n=1 Tax=Anguilla anguilla TaxID=7936 RepID=A0A0E9TZD9_ANGAN